jgi:hypothetical protein
MVKDGEQGNDPLKQCPATLPVHTLEPDESVHLADRIKERSLDGPLSEVRTGGYPEPTS